MNTFDFSRYVKETAYSLGFEYVGFSEATELTEEGKRLEQWLNKGFHGKMGYMENHFEKRIDPRKLVEGAKSVITLLYNYHTTEKQADADAPKISMYALGEDYHHVIKDKLKIFLNRIEEKIGTTVNGRCFVDSAPVMEREWAKRSGTGWLGKNTLLINPKAGSYYFLAELISDLELEYDGAMKDYCGTCTRCIDACPTEAISPQGYLMDSSKCISYLTIELKEAIPTEFQNKMENWMYGCDICQEVCPWNRFSKQHQETAFTPKPELLTMSKREWLEVTEDIFQNLFKKSAVKRTKFEGLKRNIKFLLPVLWFFLSPLFSDAQSLAMYQKAGDKALGERKYTEAISYYQTVLEAAPQKDEVRWHLAEACRLAYLWERAETEYKTLWASRLSGKKIHTEPQLVATRLGEVLKNQEKYDEALTFYKQTNLAEEINWLQSKKYLLRDTLSKLQRLDKSVNTEFSEFNPFEINGILHWSAMKFEQKNEITKLSRIVSKKDKNGLEELKTTKYHIANGSYEPNTQVLIYARCEGEGDIDCQLFKTAWSGKNWSTPEKLPTPIYMSDCSNTQPYIYMVNKNYWLLFVSDRKGGEGGFDLWCSKITDLKNNLFEPPVPLLELNTAGNEVSPFFDKKLGRIYFSSDAGVGYGGFDIYSRAFSEGKPIADSTTVLLPAPYNGGAHDLYYYVNDGDSTGYISSNRLEGNKKQANCCYDIFSWKKDKPKPKRTVEPPVTALPPIVAISSDRKLDTLPKTEKEKPDTDIAEKVRQLLPIALYFANDEPDSNSMATTTEKIYSETWLKFYYPLKNQYKVQYSKELNAYDMAIARTKVEDFFENTAKKEFEKLPFFYESLKKILSEGKTVEIVVGGYTSPRAETVYNQALAARRIQSFINDFSRFEMGVFEKYIQLKKLKMTTVPLGERDSPKDVEDRYDLPRLSVFSPEASKERRIEVLSIIVSE